MVPYAAVRYFEQFEDRSLKNIGRWLGTFFVYSIIAVLIAAVILLPVILPVLGTDRFKAQTMFRYYMIKFIMKNILDV